MNHRGFGMKRGDWFWVLVLLAITFTARLAIAAPVQSGPHISQIDEFIARQIQRHRLPGLALAVVDGDQVVLMKGYGKADSSGRSITPQTPFLLASVSKPLTASAVMQLVEAGRFELDAPVQRYVPDFRMTDAAASSQITVRHLLLHTSGIPATACDTRKNADTLAEYVAELQTVSPSAPPGARHSYCSGNYNLLGRIVENVSGQTFGDYLQQHLFTPLNMQHSFTSEAEARLDGLAQGYQWFFGLRLPTHHRYNSSQLPSGAIISSAEDLSHFLIVHLNQGQYSGARLLSPESVAAMQVPGVARSTNPASHTGEYGFGWVIAPVGEVPAIWHDGAAFNYHSLLLMQPEKRRGVVLLFNSFGLVESESAFKEIETGVARLVAGLEPAAETGSSLGRLYFVIDFILAALLALALWPLLSLRRWQRWLLQRQETGSAPFYRVTLRALAEIGAALGFLAVIRGFVVSGLGAQSWTEVLAAFPDFVAWIWAIALIGLGTGAARLILIQRVRQAELRSRAPASTATAMH